ncbi:MAG: hypothetical protein RL154_558 [Pseudomonadota bacterium]|jgi:transposase
MSNIYKQGLHRNQQLLLPPSIDDYVDNDNSVRAIESYVNILDMNKLNFSNTRKSNRNDGQKAYSPKLLLKNIHLWLSHKIRSSRALERECKRNIELIWLTQGLTPTYHTISDFRKDNPKALKQVFKEFVLLCKNIDLIGDGVKAVDGAFLRANASKNRLITKKTLEQDLAQIDRQIEEYLTSLEFSDKDSEQLNIANKLPKDLDKLQHKYQELKDNLQLLEDLDKTQYNTTDPDASLMIKPAHNLMAYNSQIVVDEKFKFIVATDISSKGNDTEHLYKMAKETKENLVLNKNDSLSIVADTGYYSAKELKKCSDDNVNAFVPEANKQQVQIDKGKFERDKFAYDKADDCYICPNEKILHKRAMPQIKNDKTNFIYTSKSTICKTCPLKDKCLPNQTSYKQIARWEDEEIIEAHRKIMRTQKAKDIVKQRGSIVEHPFGAIKRTLGWNHFLVRGRDRVSGENALIVFTYNFRRLLNLIGITLFQKLLNAISSKDNQAIEQIKQDIIEYILCFYLYLSYFFMLLINTLAKRYKIKGSLDLC